MEFVDRIQAALPRLKALGHYPWFFQPRLTDCCAKPPLTFLHPQRPQTVQLTLQRRDTNQSFPPYPSIRHAVAELGHCWIRES